MLLTSSKYRKGNNMKKLISAGMIILMLVLFLSSCGGNSETDKNDAGKDGQQSDTVSAAVLDNSNSTTVIFHDMVIRIPNRFGSKTSASDENNYFFKDSESGGDQCMIMIAYADSGISEKDYSENEDYFASSLQSGFEGTFSDVKRKDSKKQTIDGKFGYGYQFEGKQNGTDVLVYDDFVYVNNGEVYLIGLMKSADVDEDMSGIYQRIIESISIAESSSQSNGEQELDQGSADSTGMRPEIKEAIDAYEEFLNTYCDFLESFDSTNFSMLAKYAELVSQYTEMQKQFDTLGNSDLNEAELAYYTEVSLRCSAKLLEASANIASDMSSIVGSMTG